MIKVQLEFHSVPEAIIALNAIMNLPEVKTIVPNVTMEKAARRGRADKGQKRGEYRPRTEPSVPTTEAVSAVEPKPVAAPVAPSEVVKAEIIAHAPVAATIGDKDAEAQKYMEVLHGKKGLDACRMLLGQFGVSRIREIPTARRAEFLEEAKKKAAE